MVNSKWLPGLLKCAALLPSPTTAPFAFALNLPCPYPACPAHASRAQLTHPTYKLSLTAHLARPMAEASPTLPGEPTGTEAEPGAP